MHRNRLPLALSLLSLIAVLASGVVLQNIELGGQNSVAQMGIEGEGDIPLPSKHA